MASIEMPTMPKGAEEYQTYSSPTQSMDNDDSNNKLSKPNKQSGIPGASANLVNSIVGAGIIGIPYALRKSGLLAGLILLVLVAYLTDKSLKVIVGLASFHPKLKNRDVRSFEDLASYPFGNAGVNFVLVNMFIMAYGAMLAYLLIIKDTIPTILGVENRFERTLIMIATSITIMLPLSMQRDMANLSITSLFSVLADVVLVGFITAYSPMKESVAEAGGLGKILFSEGVQPTVFIGLGILSTAMACQHSAFIVSGSLKNKTMSRWAKVTGFSIGISTILCIILGTAGYLGFLDNTKGNVLNNFDNGSVLANTARFLLAITMFFTYPMECFVARHVVVQLMYGGDLDGTEGSGFGFLNRRQMVTFSIYLMTLLPALIVDGIGPVLSITGSLGGGCIAYMGPGLCYLGVNGDAFFEFALGLLGNPQNAGSAVTMDDLPVAGNANSVMTPASTSLDDCRKPFWWYVLGFPIWTSIASFGDRNMKRKLGHINTTSQTTNDNDTDTTMIPNGLDFLIAIFFIWFGVISMIAGVGSNIYQIINGDD